MTLCRLMELASSSVTRMITVLCILTAFQMLLLAPLSTAVIAESGKNSQFSVQSSLTTRCKSFNNTSCQSDGTNCAGEQTCPYQERSHHTRCYVLWTNSSEGKVVVEYQGCIIGDDSCHNETRCIARNHRSEISEHKPHIYCCCRTDNCNLNFTWEPPVDHTPLPDTAPKSVLMIVFCILGTLVVIVVFVVLGFYYYRKSKLQPYFYPLSASSGTGECTLSGSITASNSILGNQGTQITPPAVGGAHTIRQHIQLLQLKATGRFGAIWRAKCSNKFVAVKIFPATDYKSWDVEKEVYGLPQFSHANLLQFYGVQKHGEGNNSEYWLITAYHDIGSLCDYLNKNTLVFENTCKIAEGIAKGLAFLHEEIPGKRNEAIKPIIAHRDFKSKNVLLKQDLTACIADFGLALMFYPGESPGDAHGQVGTHRYMAPEVLEGAISFQPDAFLRIDMYACGLVLWELLSRTPLPNQKLEGYRLPFEAIVGSQPSLINMQKCVVVSRLRPAIDELWLQHPGYELMVSTMEECWDHDSEARLTAACVVERLSPKNIKLECEQKNTSKMADRLRHFRLRSKQEFNSSLSSINNSQPLMCEHDGQQSNTQQDSVGSQISRTGMNPASHQISNYNYPNINCNGVGHVPSGQVPNSSVLSTNSRSSPYISSSNCSSNASSNSTRYNPLTSTCLPQNIIHNEGIPREIAAAPPPVIHIAINNQHQRLLNSDSSSSQFTSSQNSSCSSSSLGSSSR